MTPATYLLKAIPNASVGNILTLPDTDNALPYPSWVSSLVLSICQMQLGQSVENKAPWMSTIWRVTTHDFVELINQAMAKAGLPDRYGATSCTDEDGQVAYETMTMALFNDGGIPVPDSAIVWGFESDEDEF